MRKAEIATKYISSTNQLVATKSTTYRFRTWSIAEELREALRKLADVVKMQGEILNKLIERTNEKNPGVKEMTEALSRTSDSMEKMTKTLEAKLPGIYPELNADQTQRISKTVLKALTKKKRTVLFSAEGDLFLDAKKKFCYPLSTGKMRIRIIQILTENHKFVPTEMLANQVGTSRKSLEYAIDRMNALGKQKLKDITLIDGRRSTGYRIHPDIFIKKV